MTDYQVRTEVYSGPMDLLLFLIRRNEVDIYDIPVARITEQYIGYIDMLRSIDPNVAGEFLVLAATLMEIKSRMLLPRPPAATEDESDDLSDPRLELVRQLLEYKKYKDASFALAERADRHAAKWPRIPAKITPPSPGEVDLEDVQIWDLVAAFNKLMQSIGVRPTTHDVVFDDTPISLHAVDIIDRLQAENGRMTFIDVFSGRTKSEMIGLFLALLELIRQKRVRVHQETAFGPILVDLLSAEPIEIGEETGELVRNTLLGDAVTPAEAESPLSAEGPTTALDEDEDADDEFDDDRFTELDAIKTDVDIALDLPSAGKPRTASAPEDEP